MSTSKNRPPAKPVNRIIRALNSASQTDLDEINNEIERLSDELSKLKRSREIIMDVLGIETEPSGRGGIRSLNRRKALDFLATVAEPQSGPNIMRTCDIPMGSLSATLTHEWFDHDATGYQLSNEGRKAASAWRNGAAS